MSVRFKFEGARELEQALANLKRGTAKGVTRRVLKKVLKPVAAAADGASPFDIAITSKLTPRQRRGARADFARSVVSMYVGPVDDEGNGVPHAHLIEFGTGPRSKTSNGQFTGAVSPRPFLRPAWDARAPMMLEELGRELWIEIEKTIERAQRRAAKAAANS